MWTYPFLWDHNLNKPEFTPVNAFTQVQAFEAIMFLRGRFLKNTKHFSKILNYFPFKKGVVLHLNKLEFPSPSDALYQV